MEAWREIVRSAGDVYSFDLALGVERVGFPRHWRDELAKLEAGLEKLRERREGRGNGRPIHGIGKISRRTAPGFQRTSNEQAPPVPANRCGSRRGSPVRPG